MGDRANVLVRESAGDPGVFLYTHCYGSRLPEILKTALAKRWRWDQASYLARVIFDAMTAKHHVEETGFGISTSMCDGDTRVMVVDCKLQAVISMNLSDDQQTEYMRWSFEEYATKDSVVGWFEPAIY